MSGQLNILAPSTLTVLDGAAGLAGGISIGEASGTITLQVSAGQAGAQLSLTAGSGVVESGAGNTLVLTGAAAAVNTALAGLTLEETAITDTLSLRATLAGGVQTAQTALAVEVVPQIGPVFVAPPKLVTLHPGTLLALPGLTFTDSLATGLDQLGLGAAESLSLTLAVTEGVLMLPGFSALDGVSATGLGTGTIELGFTATDIAAVNTLIAGLQMDVPYVSLGQHLTYSLWNLDGTLPRTVTSGNVFLWWPSLAARDTATYTLGSQTLVTGGVNTAATLDVTGLLAVEGGLTAGAVEIGPGATLNMPLGLLSLSGTSLDEGGLNAGGLLESGRLITGKGASFTGPVTLGGAALLDFIGTFTADGGDIYGGQTDLLLAAGAMISGNGTLVAGNFSESGLISGPGTILAPSGATLEIDAGQITGGTQLDVAGGGVMVVGPLSSLYGIFNATPLTIDNSVTLSFVPGGGQAISGGYADTLGAGGGAFVINWPQALSATVENFAPGDELIFPGLADLAVVNPSLRSFQITGLDGNGTIETFTIYTSLASGYQADVQIDAQGDEVVSVHQTIATLLTAGELAASAGVPQPLLGLSMVLPRPPTSELVLTVTSVNGTLSSAGQAPAASVTLSAASVGGLNADLAALTYTGSGAIDTLSFSSNSGVLTGMQDFVNVLPVPVGMLDGWSGVAFSAADWVTFGAIVGLPPLTLPMVVGGLQVEADLEFDTTLLAAGDSGTALVVGNGADAIVGGAAVLALEGGVTLGNGSGTGTLTVFGTNVTAAGNVTINTGSEADVLGALSVTGTLALAGGTAQVGGSLAVGGVALGGLLVGLAGGTLALGGVNGAGTLVLQSEAVVRASSYAGSGAVTLGGSATLAVAGGVQETGALAVAGTLMAASLTGAALVDAGLVSVSGAATLSGGTLVLQGGTLQAGVLALAESVSGWGVLAAPNVTATAGLLAQGGTLLVVGALNAVSATVTTGAVLELRGGESGTVVTFAGGDAVIKLDDVVLGFAGAAQMTASDAIDLVGVAPSRVSLSSSLVSVGSESFAVQGAVGVSVGADGAGGALLTLGGVLPCFARGTGILTPQGYVAVERLRPGDPVITASGARRPVRWLGWRTLDLGAAGARHARPVLVRPGAFGPGKPARALRLSPSHAVWVQGALIPVVHLVNGATIMQERGSSAVTFYHVELDRHDVVLADGLECESYLEDGNRAQLFESMGQPSPAQRGFAPYVTHGARLASVRRALHEVAQAQGFVRSFWPRLSAVGAVPEIAEGEVRLRFAQPVREVTLLAGTACPADTDPNSDDRRELGGCLALARGMRLGQGWFDQAPGDAAVWMGAKATILLPRARREVALELVAVAPSWRRGGTKPLCLPAAVGLR